ncbi:antitoxin [soil metagenome]
MWSACDNVRHMAKMIQIRNVPEDLHRVLKARAARMGTSLSDYLLSEIEMVAEKPTVAELLERLGKRRSVKVDESSATVIRRHRDT